MCKQAERALELACTRLMERVPDCPRNEMYHEVNTCVACFHTNKEKLRCWCANFLAQAREAAKGGEKVEVLQSRLSDIVALCWGYDGFNTIEGLKSLIDDVVKTAKGAMRTIVIDAKEAAPHV